MPHQDDKHLLIRLRKGDKDSFRALYELYGPQLLSFARRLTGDPDIAEDAVQNVFMRLWIRREGIDENRSVCNYLQVSVRNEIYAHFRSAFNARRERMSQEGNEFPDISSDIEKDLSAQEMEDIVGRAVENMPERRREIFVMSRRLHLSNAQIADQLGLSVRTVEKHIELALKEIRNILPVPVILLITLLW